MNEKLIVVVGAAGRLGHLVVQALQAHPGARVRALVRDPKRPSAAALAGPRVDVTAFDAVAATEAERTQAVRGAYAVISALQGGPEVIVDAQLALLHAAQAAGVRRFLPSDYSYDFFALPAGVNLNSDWRRTFAERARAETRGGIEVVHLLQGMLADRHVLGFLGVFDAERGIVRYWGDGKTPIDWTTWEDTARFAAAAALDERNVPERLFVSGDRMDIVAFAKTWERVHGRPVVLEPRGSLEELEALTERRLAAEPRNMFAWLPLMYARAVFGGQALLGPKLNGRYPEIRAETVEQAIARGAI